MTKYLLTQAEQEFLFPLFSEKNDRAKILFNFGQSFLKKLIGIELQEKTYALFEYLLDNQEKWQGGLLVPAFYRHNDALKINHINYSVREFIGWSILYPKEVDTHFQVAEDGQTLNKENPSTRLVEKDKYKNVKKVVKEKEVILKVKKESSHKLNSGFLLSQKDDILNVVITCFVEVDIRKLKTKDKSYF